MLEWLLGTYTLAYWARRKLHIKMKCCKYDFWGSNQQTSYAYSYDPFHGWNALIAECKLK
jgi:hypothetical protein